MVHMHASQTKKEVTRRKDQSYDTAKSNILCKDLFFKPTAFLSEYCEPIWRDY